MPWDEDKVWKQGELRTDIFAKLLQDAEDRPIRAASLKRVVRPSEMPWELSQHGLLKHIIHEDLNTLAETIDIYMQVILPGSRSGKHRHFAEEIFYVAEGSGYDLHWDCTIDADETGWRWINPEESQRFEWKAGDVVYIPPGTMHQHFNANPDRPCRLISSTNRVYKWAGLNNLEQVENAPEYDDGRTLEDMLAAIGLRIGEKVS